MELDKKTTILFPPDLYAHLARCAQQQGASVGQLVREACARQYGYASQEERMRAVEALVELALPVGEPADLKRESVADPDDLLP